MRKPRPEDFDPASARHKAEAIDLTGIVPLRKASSAPVPKPKERGVMTPRYRDTTTPSHHDTAPTPLSPDVFQHVRKSVKEFGKEAATHRFTQAEKQAIADLVYRYRAQGIRTSENEIARIAINYLIHDYQQHGDQSVLHRCLQTLND